jgi:site-specific DNA recombinase
VNKKIIIVPEDAETVRKIFLRYLELGSVMLLTADLDENGMRTKIRALANGRSVGGGRFGLGALSHFLKDRFYVGEIAYHGEVHISEPEPILNRSLFNEAQARLSANNVARQLKTRATASVLAGRIYDDRGNRMTPSHTNKNGVRYRYYVSTRFCKKTR